MQTASGLDSRVDEQDLGARPGPLRTEVYEAANGGVAKAEMSEVQRDMELPSGFESRWPKLWCQRCQRCPHPVVSIRELAIVIDKIDHKMDVVLEEVRR